MPLSGFRLRPRRLRRTARALLALALLAVFAVAVLSVHAQWRAAIDGLDRSANAWAAIHRELDAVSRAVEGAKDESCAQLGLIAARQVQRSQYIQSLALFKSDGQRCASPWAPPLAMDDEARSGPRLVSSDDRADLTLTLKRPLGHGNILVAAVSGNALASLIAPPGGGKRSEAWLSVGGHTADARLSESPSVMVGSAWALKRVLDPGVVIERHLAWRSIALGIRDDLSAAWLIILSTVLVLPAVARHIRLGRRWLGLRKRARLSWARVMRRFVPVYQPIVDAENGQTLGMEVLMRERRPDGRLAPPSEFLDGLIESKLIIPVTEQLFEQVADDIRRHPRLQGLFVSVNVTALHLKTPSLLLASCERFIEATRTLGTRLTLELPEADPLVLDATLMATLDQLRALGVSLALDDFGTGHANLDYLARLSPDLIKLDRNITQLVDCGDERQNIPATMVGLAHRLGVTVVVEGVESATQAAAMCKIGATLQQGFLFFRPMPATALAEALAAGVSVACAKPATNHHRRASEAPAVEHLLAPASGQR